MKKWIHHISLGKQLFCGSLFILFMCEENSLYHMVYTDFLIDNNRSLWESHLPYAMDYPFKTMTYDYEEWTNSVQYDPCIYGNANICPLAAQWSLWAKISTRTSFDIKISYMIRLIIISFQVFILLCGR